MWGHIGAHLPVGPANSPPQQLELLSTGVGIGHVGQGDAGDALRGHLPGVNMPPESQGGQDADLPAGVVALNVGGGVLLGVAVGLSLPQSVVKAQPRPDHTGEDIVGRTVEDTGDLLDLVGGQALVQGADDGDAAAHTGLKQIADPLLLGQPQQLAAVLRHQLLVGGNDTFARLQGPAGEIQRRLGPADGFHHDGHLRVLLNHGKIMHHLACKGAVWEIPHIQNIFQADQIIHLALNVPSVGVQHFSHTGAHHAKS